MQNELKKKIGQEKMIEHVVRQICHVAPAVPAGAGLGEDRP